MSLVVVAIIDCVESKSNPGRPYHCELSASASHTSDAHDAIEDRAMSINASPDTRSPTILHCVATNGDDKRQRNRKTVDFFTSPIGPQQKQ
jgi:hypothetical protein